MLELAQLLFSTFHQTALAVSYGAKFEGELQSHETFQYDLAKRPHVCNGMGLEGRLCTKLLLSQFKLC